VREVKRGRGVADLGRDKTEGLISDMRKAWEHSTPDFWARTATACHYSI